MAGTSVSIAGTNFDVPANDRATFNITSSPTSTATSTQINTTVPLYTLSGRITIATPYGTAISTQDFYVPFQGYTTADIGYTGRVSMGGTQTVSVNSPNMVGMLLFDGTAGQGVSLQLSGSTFAS